MSDSARRVAERFLQASAPIVVKEVGANLEVSGPYDKMKDLIPYLRGKLEYRGGDKTWWVPKAKMTPLKIKNLQKKIDAVNGVAGEPSGSQAEESQAEKDARNKAARELLREARALRIPGFSFSSIEGEGLQLTGDLEDLRVAINKAGGDYGPEFSKFFPHLIKPKSFEDLLEALRDQGKLIAKAKSDLATLLPRRFTRLGIDIGFNSGGYLFVVSGKTYDYKDEIKSRVPVTFKGQGRYWAAPLHKVKEGQVKELLEYLEGLEEALKPKDNPAAPAMPNRPNRKGDHCLDCGGWVNPGEGYLINHYDSEEGDFIYKVQHKDPDDCAKVRIERKVRNEVARTKAEARKNLRDMCMAPEYYVRGEGNQPQGDKVYLDRTSIGYGGGSWVVLEPGGNYFWYVQGNGADGDDWSRNNMPGAIGYRLPLTDEARVLIDVAKE